MNPEYFYLTKLVGINSLLSYKTDERKLRTKVKKDFK
jgi:hypothetical protein